jgi:hypothetical protein
MAAVAALVSRVQEEGYLPGELMQHLAECAATGHPFLRRVFGTLLAALWALFLQHLVIFLLDGVAPDESTPAAPALGLDAGADPPHRAYRLDNTLLPASVGASTRESILYVGRVAATLKREGKALPRSLVDKARRDVLASDVEGLDAAVQRSRAEVGEWLWTHILTGPQVSEAIETLWVPNSRSGPTNHPPSANYFLTRDADFALSVIREIDRLHTTWTWRCCAHPWGQTPSRTVDSRGCRGQCLRAHSNPLLGPSPTTGPYAVSLRRHCSVHPSRSRLQSRGRSTCS